MHTWKAFIKLTALFLLVASSCFGQQQPFPGGGGGGGVPATNAVYVSTTCGNAANCFQVFADGRLACSVSFANASSSITTASSDPIFVSTDATDHVPVYATNQACNNGVGVSGTIILPLGTISTVTGTHTATVSTTSNNSCVAGGCSLIWGHDDTLAINNAWAASTTMPCKQLQLPVGGFIVSNLIQNSISICQSSSGFPAGLIYSEGVEGISTSSSVLFPLPSIDYTNATLANGGAFFGIPNNTSKHLANFSLYGGNSPCTNATSAVAFYGNFESYFQNLTIQQWCVGTPASVAIDLNGAGNSTTIGANLTAFGVGAPCFFGHFVTVYGALCMGSGESLIGTGGGTANPVQTYGVQFVNLSSGNNNVGCANAVNWYSFGDFFQTQSNVSAALVNSCGTLYLEGDQLVNAGPGPGGYALYGNMSGVITHAKNTLFSAVNETAINLGASGHTFFDDGGNTFTGAINNTSGGWSGRGNGDTFRAACTGVATASQTLGLFGTGPNVTLTTCTSTTIGSGLVMNSAGTLRALFITSTAAGVNASSGVVTILKNGATQAMTCTIGTGTSCADQTHTISYVAGDLVSIQFTTQAADTLAGVKAIVVAN